MSTVSTVDVLREQILKLSVPDRLMLADQIWDSLPDNEMIHPPISDARLRELDRRVALHRTDPTSGQSWDDVKQEILGR